MGTAHHPPRIALFGATGYTGRLVALELIARGLPVVLVGRNRGRLDALLAWLRQQLGGVEPARVEVRLADLTQPATVATALDGCRLVIACAGPFARLGDPLVEAALDRGVHLVAPAAEPAWLLHLWETYDTRAQRQGCCLVAGIGLVGGLGDLLAALVGRGLEPLVQVRLRWRLRAFHPSRGTLRSALDAALGESPSWTDGAWQHGAKALRAWRSALDTEPAERPCVPLPGPEAVSIPQQLDTQQVWSAFELPLPMGPLARVVARLPQPKDCRRLVPLAEPLLAAWPEGPPSSRRRLAHFELTVEAQGVRPNERGATKPATKRAVLRGSDVYATTAWMLAETAVLLCDGGDGLAGVRPPALVVDPASFLARVPHLTLEQS